MRTTRIVALALALLVGAPAAAEEAFKIVVHRAVKVESLSRDELSRIFLKKSTRWPGQAEMKPVEPRDDSPARQAFVARVHGMSPGALRSYWNNMIFSGRDVPPVEKGSDQAVVDYVREHPGAIGYVAAGADASGVTVVQVR